MTGGFADARPRMTVCTMNINGTVILPYKVHCLHICGFPNIPRILESSPKVNVARTKLYIYMYILNTIAKHTNLYIALIFEWPVTSALEVFSCFKSYY